MSSTHVATPTTRPAFPKARTGSTLVAELIGIILRAIEHTKCGRRIDHEIDEASLLLESLPLTTEEFGLSSNRLRNAHRYVLSGEAGAAAWELGTLRKFLCRHAEEWFPG